MKIKSHLSGTNNNSWVHPWERDSTRGTPLLTGPSMHSSEVEATMNVASCVVCGVNFGYGRDGVKEHYCPSHRWLQQSRLLGHPVLEHVDYVDPLSKKYVHGNNVRWSYVFLEDNVFAKEKLKEGLRDWLREGYLEKYGYCTPKIVVTNRGVVVSDIHHLAWGDYADVDNFKLSKLFDEMDKVYVEAL